MARKLGFGKAGIAKRKCRLSRVVRWTVQRCMLSHLTPVLIASRRAPYSVVITLRAPLARTTTTHRALCRREHRAGHRKMATTVHAQMLKACPDTPPSQGGRVDPHQDVHSLTDHHMIVRLTHIILPHGFLGEKVNGD